MRQDLKNERRAKGLKVIFNHGVKGSKTVARLKNFQNEPITSSFKYYKVIDGQDLDTQCAWNKFKGERCPKKGTMSDNTNGYPPYYCSEHWDFVHNRVDDPRPNAKKRGFAKVGDTVKKIDKTRKFF